MVQSHVCSAPWTQVETELRSLDRPVPAGLTPWQHAGHITQKAPMRTRREFLQPPVGGDPVAALLLDLIPDAQTAA